MPCPLAEASSLVASALPSRTRRAVAITIEVRRARSGPGLWPGPRRQARWAGRGLQGQRRAAGASRAAGCEAPLRLEEPARIMRGVPPGRCDIFTAIGTLDATLTAWPCCWRARPRDTAGTASGRSPGPRCAAARRAVGPASEGRGESCRPATARPGVNPGRPRRVTLAALSSRLFVPVRCSRPGAVGSARRRCALETVEKLVTAWRGVLCAVPLDALHIDSA